MQEKLYRRSCWVENMLLVYKNTCDGVSWEKQHDSSVLHFDHNIKRSFWMEK